MSLFINKQNICFVNYHTLYKCTLMLLAETVAFLDLFISCFYISECFSEYAVNIIIAMNFDKPSDFIATLIKMLFAFGWRFLSIKFCCM